MILEIIACYIANRIYCKTLLRRKTFIESFLYRGKMHFRILSQPGGIKRVTTHYSPTAICCLACEIRV